MRAVLRIEDREVPGLACAQDTGEPLTPRAANVSILAFPRDGNAYTESFYRVLCRKGARVVQGDWSGRWLLRHAREFDLAHFHWPSFCYEISGGFHQRTFSFLRFVALLLIIRASGTKIVWTIHNLYPHDGGKRVLWHRLGRAIMSRLSSRVFAHGPTATERVRKELPVLVDKLRTIDHGHFIDYYERGVEKDVARRRLMLPGRRYIYLFIGLCKEYKNLEALIRAFEELEDDSLLLIAGAFQSDRYRTRIEGLVRNSKATIVMEPNRIPNDEIQYYLEATDIVVLPYAEILTSGAVMLALSFGRPVIAPEQGHLCDVVSPECGITYASQATTSLVMAMRRAKTMTFDREVILAQAHSYDWGEIGGRFLSQLPLSRPSVATS